MRSVVSWEPCPVVRKGRQKQEAEVNKWKIKDRQGSGCDRGVRKEYSKLPSEPSILKKTCIDRPFVITSASLCFPETSRLVRAGGNQFSWEIQNWGSEVSFSPWAVYAWGSSHWGDAGQPNPGRGAEIAGGGGGNEGDGRRQEAWGAEVLEDSCLELVDARQLKEGPLHSWGPRDTLYSFNYPSAMPKHLSCFLSHLKRLELRQTIVPECE